VINLPGRGEVFVRDSGGAPADPAVLLLHGWTASADLNFFPVYARLAERYRVIALDLRGHGRGMRSTEPFSLEDCADDAAALLDQLGTEYVIVVGYSMGGPVGMLPWPGGILAGCRRWLCRRRRWSGTARSVSGRSGACCQSLS
jgi:3-oxoadipate enol-lactonase